MLKHKTKDKVAMMLLIIGFLYTLASSIFLFLGSEICKADGCRAAAQTIKVSSSFLYLSATVFFAFMFVVFLYKERNNKTKIYPLFLSAAIVFETFLFWYNYFVMDVFCPSCFIVWIILVFLGVLHESRLIFVSLLITAFFATFLIKPIKNDDHLFPSKENLVLVSSDKCPHCKDVKKFLRESRIPFIKKGYKKEEAILETLGIDIIPVAFYKTDKGIFILAGESQIKSFFAKESKPKKIPPTQRNNIFTPSNSAFQGGSLPKQEGCSLKNWNCEN